uniref:Transmembrane protein 268 n=1 Tax=Glossina pallidipes TaxID=7398 RepID=A0A1A9ZHV2_GLOPL
MSLNPSDHTKNTNITQHPLQDVTDSLSSADRVDSLLPQNIAAKSLSKENWVKFDDDVNANTDGSVSGENKTVNYNNNSNDNSDQNTRESETTNRLQTPSPIPPPIASKRQTAVKVKPDVVGDIPTNLNSQSNTEINSTATIQPYLPTATQTAPAVLPTESIHVNLNASGKTQQPNSQQQQQQHHNQKPKTPTKAASAAIVSPHGITNSNNNNNSISNSPKQLQQQQQQQQQQHNQLPHLSNNGTTASTAVVATINNSHSNNSPSRHVTLPVESQPPMRTIELSTGRIREGFANGDVIVTLLPANTKWPWITPAVFRPELVPEELMAQGLTLTVEEYVHAMETLVNDYRFTVYNICYKRILVCWILFAFTVLLTLLFSGLQGVALFSLGVGWLFLNAAAIFLCMWIKLRLARGLEKCLARVNKQLIKHKILLILDDRGRISCHKVNLCFLYFDSTQCVNFLNEFLEQTEQNGGEAIKAGWEAKLDIDLNDIVIQGSNPVRLSRKQAVAQELYLSYLQRWGKDFLRRRLDWTVQEAGVHETPRHLQSSICPCQYEEEVLRNKIKLHLQRKQCCGINCLGCWL